MTVGSISGSSSALPRAVAQTTAKVHLEQIFSFLPSRPDRAVCYRVCRAWLSACTTNYSANVLDYELTSESVFTWNTLRRYITSISKNPASPRLHELPQRSDSAVARGAKLVAIIQKAGPSIKTLNFKIKRGKTLSKYKEIYRLLFSISRTPPRFPNATRLTINLPEMMDLTDARDITLLENILYHLPCLQKLVALNMKVAVLAVILRRAQHSDLRELIFFPSLNKDGNDEAINLGDSITQLETISFKSTCSNDEQLKDLARLFQGAKVRIISLSSSLGFRPITDEGINPLQSLPTLQELSLYDLPYITDSSLEVIGTLPELLTLDISHCEKLTSSGISSLKKAKKLATLKLQDMNLKGEFPTLSQLPALRNLSIIRWCSPVSIPEIGRCMLLTTLELTRFVAYQNNVNSVSSVDIAYLKNRLPNLKSLKITN